MINKYNGIEERFFLDNFNVDKVFSSIVKADYLYLYYIAKEKQETASERGVYLSEIAEKMGISIADTSRAMKRLQEKGYVYWNTNEEKNKTYIELTGYALELMNDEKEKMREYYKVIKETVPPDELAITIRTMQKISEIVSGMKQNADE